MRLFSCASDPVKIISLKDLRPGLPASTMATNKNNRQKRDVAGFMLTARPLMRAGFLFAAAAGLMMTGAVASFAQTSTPVLSADEALARLDRLDDEVAKIWASSPLAFRSVTLVNSVEGFGDFKPRDGNNFKAGETLMVYVEPVGFSYVPENGRYSFALSADLSIESDAGHIIVEGEDLFLIDESSLVQIREFHMVLSVEVPEIKAGGYKAVYQVKDMNSGKTGSFAVPFKIGE